MLSRILTLIPTQWAEVLSRHHGLGGRRGEDIAEIARSLGLSIAMVNGIRIKATNLLRSLGQEPGLRDELQACGVRPRPTP